jgi:hypothetical protein
MVTFDLDSSNRFSITAYQQQRPFASFLPGIAGRWGIPMWVFYINRGQAVASFGIESKDSPMMEFQPANKAYQVTPYLGFRTFLKLSRGSQELTYEPFSFQDTSLGGHQKMIISSNHLELEEVNTGHGLSTHVLYFILPGESFAGLVRKVTFYNLGNTPLALDILDGMPAVIPYGVNNNLLKEIGRTVEAWMEVFNLDARLPFYRVRASVIDRAEVETFKAGHFALALAESSCQQTTQPATLLPVMVDPAAVFGQDTSFYSPTHFYQQPSKDLLAARQVRCGRTPCCLFAHQARLAAGESLSIYSLYGHISSLEVLQRHTERITRPGYFEGKYLEAKDLADEQTGYAETITAERVFDAYCRQNFLDNVLRGGLPILLGDPRRPHVYPIYSRKHGDLERDYNAFFVTPEPLSQGEGSYRDVNQNRRDTVRMIPAVGDYDIRTFLSLIQTDGYNPRTIKGGTFTLSPTKLEGLLEQAKQPEALRGFLSKPFTPGRLLKYISDREIELLCTLEAFLNAVLAEVEQHIEAEFHEGYWIDHWEYNLDLIESYLATYPECQNELLFGSTGLPFFESAMFVQPRDKKYVLVNSTPKQIGSLVEDAEKAALIAARADIPHWTRTQHGRGTIYTAPVITKLVLTALLKFATLDPWGMGIEMEAGRPGWYDALNGLPALFGSGVSETYELQRWLSFIRQAVHSHGGGKIRLPVEAAALLGEINHQLEIFNANQDIGRDFTYWDAVSTARESYRQDTCLGLDGKEKVIALEELDRILAAFQKKMTAGIARAVELNGGIPPTYITYQVDDYVVLEETDAQGRAYIRAKHFTPQVLPLFLEAPVHALKIMPDTTAARKLYQRVKGSPLFDRPLMMYKVNAPLDDQPIEIGRARAFPPGWLENQSIWLHMEYKYLLEVLKAGLYEEFWEDARHTLVPFLDPQRYGRSTLENSSFLVSSAHPDPSLHGSGFVARLTGATAEFISLWNVMMAGSTPFTLQDGQLCLAFKPALPGWLFKPDGTLSFRFAGSCTVTYHNPDRLDTYLQKMQVRRMVLQTAHSETVEVRGATLGAVHAAMVRQGEISRVDVWF